MDSKFEIIKSNIELPRADSDSGLETHTHNGTDSALISFSEKYIDRGDAISYDFSLTSDATWREIDLSPIILGKAKLVLLGYQILGTALADSLQARTKGYTGVNKDFGMITTISNYLYGTFLIKPDDNLIIEYNSASTLTTSNLIVRGWWI